MILFHSIARRLIALLGFISAASLPAQLVISNWNITTSSIAFDISGQIQTSADLGANSRMFLYIGDPGNPAWVTSTGSTGTVTNHGGGSVNLSTSSFGTGNSSGVSGDDVHLVKDGFVNWSKLDSVDASISITAGTYVPGAIDFSDMIVAVGYADIGANFPNLTNQVGYVASAVPEPSTYAAMLGGLALGLVGLRRKKRSAVPHALP